MKGKEKQYEHQRKMDESQWKPSQSKENIVKAKDQPKKPEWTIKKIEAKLKKPLKNK